MGLRSHFLGIRASYLHEWQDGRKRFIPPHPPRLCFGPSMTTIFLIVKLLKRESAAISARRCGRESVLIGRDAVRPFHKLDGVRRSCDLFVTTSPPHPCPWQDGAGLFSVRVGNGLKPSSLEDSGWWHKKYFYSKLLEGFPGGFFLSLLDDQGPEISDRGLGFLHDPITKFLHRRNVVDTSSHGPP